MLFKISVQVARIREVSVLAGNKECFVGGKSIIMLFLVYRMRPYLKK